MIWIGLIILVVGVAINMIVSDSHPGIYLGTLLVGFGVTIIIVSFYEDYETNPSAMDVYQGKTTLEITYKDNVAIDSVVVFKSKEK